MRLFVTRHGQTDWNLQNRLQGWADNPINQTGIKQAEELRDKIKDIKGNIIARWGGTCGRWDLS
jgi:broad specificity phosphatase PhoE